MKRKLPALLLSIGLALFAGSGFAIWSEISFRDGAVETDGQIVEMQRQRSSSDRKTSYTYLPVFTFTLPDGTRRQVAGSFASNPPCCAVGDRVRVRYRPEAPERAAMASFAESWFFALLLGGMGLLVTMAGGILLVMRGSGGSAAVAKPAAPAQAMTFAVPLVGLRRQKGQWFLQARWADPRSGGQRLFERAPIPFDPVPQMQAMTSVPVRFDPADPDGPYAMDLSFLRAPG